MKKVKAYFLHLNVQALAPEQAARPYCNVANAKRITKIVRDVECEKCLKMLKQLKERQKNAKI